jgi:hypothetical protein
LANACCWSTAPRDGERRLEKCCRRMLRPSFARLEWKPLLDRCKHLQVAGSQSSWGRPECFDRDHSFDPHGSAWHLDRQLFDDDLLAAARGRGRRLSSRRAVQVCQRCCRRSRMECRARRSRPDECGVRCRCDRPSVLGRSQSRCPASAHRPAGRPSRLHRSSF